MVAARRRSASSGPLRGLQRHVRRRARSCVQSNLPAMPTIGEGGLIPPISGQSRMRYGGSRAEALDELMRSDNLGLEDSVELDRLAPADDFVSSQHLRVSGQTREQTRDRVRLRPCGEPGEFAPIGFVAKVRRVRLGAGYYQRVGRMSAQFSRGAIGLADRRQCARLTR